MIHQMRLSVVVVALGTFRIAIPHYTYTLGLFRIILFYKKKLPCDRKILHYSHYFSWN